MPETWYATDSSGYPLSGISTEPVRDNNTTTGIYLDFEYIYAIVNDFGEQRTITQIAVYNDIDQVAVEYWSGNNWVLLGYTGTSGWTYFNNINITTTKWRVRPRFYDAWVGEMQRTVSGGQTQVQVSDTGSGAESITVYLDGAILKNVTDSGLGTESINLDTGEILITEGTRVAYDAFGNVVNNNVTAVYDNNPNTYFTIYGIFDDYIPAYIVHDFGTTHNVVRLRVDFSPNAPLALQYWSGSSWVTITTLTSSGEVTGNWSFQRWRVIVGSGYYGEVNIVEMKAYRTTVVGQTVAVSDSGTGSETVLMQKQVADGGVGSEQAILPILINMTDSGTGTESTQITVTYLITVTDSGVGTESLVFPLKGLNESGFGADAVNASMSFILSDSGTGTDTLSLIFAIHITDFGFGSDSVPITATELTETGLGVETADLVKECHDVGTGTDALLMLRFITVNDAGVGTETVNRALLLTERGSLSENCGLVWNLSDASVGREFVERVPHTALLAFLKELIKDGSR